MADPEDILRFWLDEVGPEGWYRQDDALDTQCRDLFLEEWEAARESAHRSWLTWPRGTLAYVILVDQLPRNMFRDDARAYATDKMARAVAKKALEREWDLQVDEPARQFFYLPLMHSENLPDQERCVRLILTRMPRTGADNLRHAKAHREVIRRFGRFPHRNAELGRDSTTAERKFLEEGGYGAVLRSIPETAAS